MVDRVQVGARVNADVYEEFKQYVREEAGEGGGSIGRELERAMRDRMGSEGSFSRIEEKLDRIEEKVDKSGGDESTPTPTSSSEPLEREKLSVQDSSTESEGYGGRTEQKIQAIVANIADQPKVKESWLEREIEEHAGASFKTIQKYKRLLRHRGYAIEYPSPSSDMYYTDTTPLALKLERDGSLSDESYTEFVEEMNDVLGEGWYLEAIPEEQLCNWLEGDGLRYDTTVSPVEMTAQDFAEEKGIIDRNDGRSFQ